MWVNVLIIAGFVVGVSAIVEFWRRRALTGR